MRSTKYTFVLHACKVRYGLAYCFYHVSVASVLDKTRVLFALKKAITVRVREGVPVANKITNAS